MINLIKEAIEKEFYTEINIGICDGIYAINFPRILLEIKKHERLIKLIESFGFSVFDEKLNFSTGQISLFAKIK